MDKLNIEKFDFSGAPADLYLHPRKKGWSHGQVRHLRFPSGAEAVQHAIEVQSALELASTFVEVDDIRVGALDIRALYESDRYPLERHVRANSSERSLNE